MQSILSLICNSNLAYKALGVPKDAISDGRFAKLNCTHKIKIATKENAILFNMDKTRPLFVYFRPSSHYNYKHSTKFDYKSIDDVLGIRTWDRWMVCADESTLTIQRSRVRFCFCGFVSIEKLKQKNRGSRIANKILIFAFLQKKFC